MFSWLTKVIFKWWGWKIEGEIPNHLPKKLYVVIPHTSNWDFPVGILMKFAYKMEVGFIAKSSLFKWPTGWLFRWLGGISVDRSKSMGFIDAVVQTINERKRFCTAIAPEGTRHKVDRLKSGFYYIAKNANIPIVYVKFDWKNKTVGYEKPKEAAASQEEEIQYATQLFKNVVGCVPEHSFGYPFEGKKPKNKKY